MQNTARVIELLDEIIHMGLSLSLDEFGTGYSSLSQLKSLHFHTVKIDRSFIKDLSGPLQSGNTEGEEFVQAIIAMSHSLKRTVVAEGIETRIIWKA